MGRSKSVAFYDLHTRIRSPIIFSMLHLKRGDTVLDLGSGTGYFAEEMCEEHATALCLDISLENLLSIKKRHLDNVCLIQAEGEKLPFKDESFDSILCSEVIEHIREDRVVLQEIARILRPGGSCIITVPSSEYRFPSVIDLLRVKTVHDYEGPEKHYRKGYNIADFSLLLSSAGLVVSEYVYFSHFFSKLMLDTISIFHLLVRRIFIRQKAWNWADIQDLDSSVVFAVFKLLFPFFLLISKLDKLLFLSSKAKGCGLAIGSKKLL